MKKPFLVLIVLTAFTLVPPDIAAQGTPVARPADEVCAPYTDGTPEASTEAPTGPEIDLTMLEFDLIFLDAMIPHLESGIAMAEVALDRSERPEIDGLTAAIIDGQRLQVDTMRALRREWYPDFPALTQQQLVGAMTVHLSDNPGVGGLAGLEEMDPAHRAEDLVAVCESGDEIDITFIDTLIAHNASAIILAKEANARALHRETRQLATSIVDAQQFEIDQVLHWREQWFAGTPIPDHHGA